MIDDTSIINFNVEVLRSLFQDIPCTWENYESIQSFVADNFTQYLIRTRLFQGWLGEKLKQNSSLPTRICSGVEKAIQYYLSGAHSDAYLQLESLLPFIDSSLQNLCVDSSPTGLAFGFRGRVVKDDNFIPSRAEMFHIPFEKRHLVREQRYGAQGVPAIYLGSSIYDCYLELDRPPIEDFFVSYFCFSQNKSGEYDPNNIRLIDLTAPKSDSARAGLLVYYVLKDEPKYIEMLEKLYHQIILWPLMKTCSLIRKYPAAPFQQEYIIPSLLFQLCVRRSNIMGIKYDTTKKINLNRHIYSYAMQNIAIPAHNIAEKGHCSFLSSSLLLTEPLAVKNTTIRNDIKSTKGFTNHGLPILSDMDSSSADYEIIRTFDSLTMVFNNMIDEMISDGNTDLIKPLSGWRED